MKFYLVVLVLSQSVQTLNYSINLREQDQRTDFYNRSLGFSQNVFTEFAEFSDKKK